MPQHLLQTVSTQSTGKYQLLRITQHASKYYHLTINLYLYLQYSVLSTREST